MGREVRVDEEEGGAEEDKCDGDGALRLERRRRPGAERVNLRSRAEPDLETQYIFFFFLVSQSSNLFLSSPTDGVARIFHYKFFLLPYAAA